MRGTRHVGLEVVTVLLALALWTPQLSLGSDQPTFQVHDWGPISGFQDSWRNQYRKGRSLVVGDFDGDGRTDAFVGNVGDDSVVYRNLGVDRDGVVRFGVASILLREELAFVASAADYDNDSDLDLFIGCGGLDGVCLDYLLRNDSQPGSIRFTDVSWRAGIRGPALDGSAVAVSTSGGTWGDYDRDGDQDLFVSVKLGSPYNILWQNNGDGTFSDVTVQVQLDDWDSNPGGGVEPVDFRYYQNSSWIDVDNDGDLDLFLNNAWGPNTLFRNLLVEEEDPRFEYVTHIFSLPGEDLRYPVYSFASAVADFNNDGWQDLMVFGSSSGGISKKHGLYLNQQGLGFFNAASWAGIHAGDVTAMGCQVADLNADGVPDLVIGDGNPETGKSNALWISQGMSNAVPIFSDLSDVIDFEPPHGIVPGKPPYPDIPPYPYRTHGIAAADFDNDGSLELAMLNGGKARGPAIVREPNRLFHCVGSGLDKTLRVRLRGDGIHDSRDGIGSRAYVTVMTPNGSRRIFGTVLGGSGFGAQNELTLTFGIGSDKVANLAILWPSGCIQLHKRLDEQTSKILVVDQACDGLPETSDPVRTWLQLPFLE